MPGLPLQRYDQVAPRIRLRPPGDQALYAGDDLGELMVIERPDQDDAGERGRQTDGAHEPELVAAGAAGSHPGIEPVAVDVQGAEDVADAMLSVTRRAQPVRSLGDRSSRSATDDQLEVVERPCRRCRSSRRSTALTV
ncbi:MAG: hypothetical protein JOZ07_14015 [Solirubrobacterales bacterium]|nr:hypothetical protein [Solirubrobacterales bacterium]